MVLSTDSEQGVWVHRLGYGGLIPFVGGAVLLFLVQDEVHPYVTIALTAYAALIASFLGGIHWGLALLDSNPLRTFHLIWGITPALLAWVGLIMPAYAGLPWLALVLLVCYGVDRKTWPQVGLRAWLTLRFRLTAVAVLSCLLGAGAV